MMWNGVWNAAWSPTVAETEGDHSTGHFATAFVQSSRHSPLVQPMTRARAKAVVARAVRVAAMQEAGRQKSVVLMSRRHSERSPSFVLCRGRGRCEAALAGDVGVAHHVIHRG